MADPSSSSSASTSSNGRGSAQPSSPDPSSASPWLARRAARDHNASSSSTVRASTTTQPSVQFDEQNLLSSPSIQRERLSSSTATDSPANSPRIASLSIGSAAHDHRRTASSATAKRSRATPSASASQRRDGNASSASTARPQHREGSIANSTASRTAANRLSSRASDASGSTRAAAKRWHQPVVTIPSWARDESPSPPQSPRSSHLTSTTSRNNNGGERGAPSPSPLPAPRLELDKHASPEATDAQEAPRDAATAEATNTWPSTHSGGVQTITEEPGETTTDSPERWWTFTLPQKYRTRLHEHHLRMSFHHQRLKDHVEAANAEATAAAADGSRATPRRSGSGGPAPAKGSSKPPKKRRTNSSNDDSPVGSDYESDNGEEDGRRGRFFDDGLAGYSADGAAARLGESGLLSWRHGGKRPPTTSVEKRSSSQSAERTLTNPQRGEDGSSGQASPSKDGDDADRDHQGRRCNDATTDYDVEKQQQQQDDRFGTTEADELKDYPTLSFKARMEHPDVYTVHQPATPGWASPWRPEERGGGHSIEIDGYRFRPNGMGYFPRTDTGRTSQRRRRQWLEWWKNFLIHNPFVPLLFRFINVCFTTATLAVAIKLFQTLHREGATDAVGSSPVVAIIFAPLTLVHVGLQIWVEYFGRPIGLWTVQSKLYYTVIELVFICFWSAELSLAFDNYFTSTLVCVEFGNPFNDQKGRDPEPLPDPGIKPYLCRLQGALIGLVFVSLLAYLVVLTVSLFRIFVRVTGGRR